VKILLGRPSGTSCKDTLVQEMGTCCPNKKDQRYEGLTKRSNNRGLHPAQA